MPRLPPSLIRRAYNNNNNKSPLLPLVLQGARTLESSINELRWLTEHVETLRPTSSHHARKLLFRLCQRRSRAEPLQYILGSQPFGELDIQCRPGVLIPRYSLPFPSLTPSLPPVFLLVRSTIPRDGTGADGCPYRPETEAYTSYLAKLLLQDDLHSALVRSERGRREGTPLTILDMCSGSGW